jgi:hypothetical protein
MSFSFSSTYCSKSKQQREDHDYYRLWDDTQYVISLFSASLLVRTQAFGMSALAYVVKGLIYRFYTLGGTSDIEVDVGLHLARLPTST